MPLLLRTAFHELQLTLRLAVRAKAFSATAILTLTVGLTGATVMFALVRGIVLRPLPVPHEERLVVAWRVPRAGVTAHVPYRSADVEAIARDSGVFEKVSGVGYNGVFEQTWRIGDASASARTVAVMGGFFDVAGVTPVLGRTFRVEDDRRGAGRLVVLSHRAWIRLFAASPDAVGRRIELDDDPFTVAGVMPPDFDYPTGTEIWTTLNALADVEPNDAFRTGLLRDVEVLGRLRPGVTLAQASGELAAVSAATEARTPGADVASFRPVVKTLKAVLLDGTDRVLAVLCAAVGVILAIAAANVASLLLMRSEARRSELAVRAALGASRGRLVAQLLVESLAIALVSGVAALAISRSGLTFVLALVPDGLPRADSIRVDSTVAAFTATVALVAAGLTAVVPAMAAARLDLVGGLGAGWRGTAGRASARGRRLLVAAEVALAVSVVATAGLLTRSVQRLQTVDMGLDTGRLVLAELDMPRDRYADPAVRQGFHDQVIARLEAVRGIESVTALNVQPFAGATGWELPRYAGEGQSAEQVALNPSLNFEVVYPGYFATLGVRILRGRAFTPADGDGALRVAVVSDTMAAATWPGQDAIGRRLKFGGVDSRDEWLTVVGVASTTRYRDLTTPRPTLYVPAAQLMMAAERLAIRTAASPAFVAGVLGEAVRAADATVRVARVASFGDYLRRPLAWPRFNALVLGLFAAAALLLSTVGLYGVIAASVRNRQREIGVRLALGSTTAGVRRLVVGETLRLASAGAAAGLLVSVAAAPALRSLLFGIEPLDPVSLTAAALVLVGAAVLASWLPARRAARVNPVEALRAQ